MESDEVRVAFLDHEGSEGEAEGYVVECIRLLVWCAGKDCRRNRELDGRGHGCGQSLWENEEIDITLCF
jgi:hypothetical protein